MSKTIVESLKESFVDCTFGGHEDEHSCYDIGLENGFAHVNIHENNKKIVVKLFDLDSNDIGIEYFNNVEEAISYLRNKTTK